MLRNRAMEGGNHASRVIAIAVCFLFAIDVSGCHRWKGIPTPEDKPAADALEWRRDL